MAVTFKNPALAYYIEPTAYGVAPTLSNSPGLNSDQAKLQFTRLVSEDLNASFTREISNEIRGDAQTSGSVITSASGSGTISIQYSLDTYDEILPGVLFSEHAAVGDISERSKGWLSFSHTADVAGLAPGASTITGDVVTTTADLDASSTIEDGDYIYISGSGISNIDGVWKVSTIVGTAITLVNDTGETNVQTYAGLTSGASIGSPTIYIMQDICENGTNDITYGLVRAYSDTSRAGAATADTTDLNDVEWSIFRGAYFTSLQLSVAPGQAGWTGSFSVLFKDEVTVTDVTSAAPGSGLTVAAWNETTAPNSNPLPDAITGVAQITVFTAGVASGAGKRFDALSLNVNISNNSEEVSALRNRGALCINQGETTATVDIELIYGEDGNELHQAMLDNDEFGIEFAVQDADNRCQLWRFPKCRLTSERPNPGKNQPIVQTLNLQVEAGGTDYGGAAGVAKMIEIIRFYAPEDYFA